MATNISVEGVNKAAQIGMNEGVINNYFSSYSETTPEPIFDVPFQRDCDFVGRGDLLGQIDQKCRKNTLRLALVGLGGVGKSQLAVEYIHRAREKDHKTWVFWVHASNASRFKQSYEGIANLVKIPGRKNPDANLMSLINAWFKDPQRKWIIVLDNVDSDRHLFETGYSDQGQAGMQQPLVTFLPQSPHGTIIMTTRNRNAALKFVSERDVIQVEPMTACHASSLLEKKLNDRARAQAKEEDILKLAEALEFMPLAMVQAAAYINRRAPKISVVKYLEEFEKGESRQVKLLGYEAGWPSRDWEAKNAILATWQISFDDIRENHSLAADLLSLMSFFDKSGIPGNALHIPEPCSSDSEHSTSIDPDEFEDNLLILEDYSLVSSGKDSSLYEMHRLVQLATRKWLEAHGRSEIWQRQFIRCLSDAFPEERINEEHWTACRSLFPHVQSALLYKPISEESLRQWASLLYSAGRYAQEEANFSAMLQISAEVTKACNERLGSVNAQSVRNTRLTAMAYENLGRYDEAENILLTLIDDCKKDLGPEMPVTLYCMSQLSWLYACQGKRQQAILLGEELVKLNKQVFGMRHQECLIAMGNLAQFHAAVGNCEISMEVGSQVVDISKELLGLAHPQTLGYMDELANTYADAGRIPAGKALIEEVFEIQKKSFRPETQQMFDAMEKVASYYQRCGEPYEAEVFAEQALQGKKRIFGPEHFNTTSAMGVLASAWQCQRRYADAVDLQESRMRLLAKTLGENHAICRSASLTLKSWQDDQIVDAARDGRKSDLERLLSEGADMNHRDFFWGRSPLSQAAQDGWVDIVSLLLKEGVDPNLEDARGYSSRQNNTGKTPLMWAAMDGRLEVCRVLLEYGAEVGLEERDGRTPLSWASEHGHPEIVEVFLRKGASINQQDCYRRQTPLSWAAMNGHMPVVELLLANGADPTLADQDNKTPSSWAEEKGHEVVVNLCRLREKEYIIKVDEGVDVSSLNIVD